jgi:endoglucanase
MKIDYDFLEKILKTQIPSTDEEHGSQLVAEYLTNLGYDVFTDAYGSLLVNKETASGDQFRVLLDAHIDEVCLKIIFIDDKGFLYVNTVGGVDIGILSGTSVKIITKKGVINGVIGSKSIHLQEENNRKIPQIEDLYIDIGASSKTEATKRVSLGDMVLFSTDFSWLSSSRICGRALDNKIGCFILTQILKTIASKKMNISVIATFTTQEEVGLKGSRYISNHIDPDMSIVIDVGASTDYPGVEEKQFGSLQLGKGPYIDFGASDHKLLQKEVMEISRQNSIEVQKNHSSTGSTNLLSYFNKGIPGITIGVLGRYLHTGVTCVDKKDIDDCIHLITAYLEHMDGKRYKTQFPILKKWTKKSSRYIK